MRSLASPKPPRCSGLTLGLTKAHLTGMVDSIRALPGVGMAPFVSAEPAQTAWGGTSLNAWAWRPELRAYAYAALPDGRGWPLRAAHASSHGRCTLANSKCNGSAYSSSHTEHFDEPSLREVGQR